MGVVVNMPLEEMPKGNMILDKLTKDALEKMKFWMRIEEFDKRLAAAQVQKFVDEFNQEMCKVVRRRMR
jgi:hypothetical protein